MRYLLTTAVVLGLLLISPQRTGACFRGGFPIQAYAKESHVIVVGTLTKAGSDMITLAVEEYLKGNLDLPEIRLKRQVPPSCMEPATEWPTGVRVLAFLTRNASTGAWQAAGGSEDGILKIDGDQIIYRFLDTPIVAGSFQAAKTELAAQLGPPHAPNALYRNVPKFYTSRFQVLLYPSILISSLMIWVMFRRQGRRKLP